jgi:hypothetical protein
MRRIVPIAVCFAALLSACSWDSSKFNAQSIEDLVRQGSGFVKTVKDTVELGKTGVQKTQAELQDLQARAVKVQLGLKKLAEGEKLLQEGLGTTSSQN